MIDKIIEYSNGNVDKDKIDDLEQEIINSNDARLMFLYAYYFSNRDLKNISEALIKTNDERYISFFFRHIKNINIDLFFQKILNYDNKTIFYCLYDRKDLDDKYFINGLSKMLINGIDRYLNLTLYYYFIILDKFNKEIFHILLNIDNKINENNYKEIITQYKNKLKEKVENYDYYSPNKYDGHNNVIPDMIVCHISFDYGKIIKNFYNKDLEVSSHFAVSENGEYTQFVDLKDSSWANGTSLNDSSDVYYKFALNDIVKNRDINANYYTYTIEHESMDGSLTQKQYQTTLTLMCKIIDYIKNTYGVDFKIDEQHIVGHHDLNPIVRLSCPGDKFPIKEIIQDLKKIYSKKRK